jgi:hypothetical protein
MPGPKLQPKVILEGTRLTHKTDIAFALNEHPRLVGNRRYRYHSPLVSAEWCGFSPEPWGRGPINFAPDQEARAMEVFATWARLFELQPYYSWLVDRFHLSAQAYQLQSTGRRISFAWLEERLLPLGFHIVLCTRRDETFDAARAARLPVSGKPSQYDDLSAFLEEQRLLRELARDARLPVLELDVSDDDIPRAADRVADWLESTGGLWAPDGGWTRRLEQGVVPLGIMRSP